MLLLALVPAASGQAALTARLDEANASFTVGGEPIDPRAGDDPGFFRYKRIGTLANGLHVLQTWEGGTRS